MENMTEVIHGDILLHNGLIQGIERYSLQDIRREYGDDLFVVDAKNSWVTPGIVDMHSHLGDSPSPELQGAIDDNSHAGIALPWMRSVDGINTHDETYHTSIAGGVTTSLILPGSGDAIGGQAFPIKLRKTKAKSTSSMLLEPPYDLNSSYSHEGEPLRWRYMKHACGENPSNWYSGTRMDTAWAFRQSYNKAKQIKEKQDEYCEKVLKGRWIGLGEFPEELQWEALVDVLRGKVKVNAHCYEAVDLNSLIRLTNEFQFPLAAVHHAHEAYLVPDLLKQAYQKPPAVALFATNARYKREAYRGSEFAPRILAEHGFQVAMKSDHPVLNSRYLLYEAQQAYYYGLPANLALASVTTTPANVIGMDHRIGFIREGFDADLVIWDSHPLALGATPSQVFIDGIAQLTNPHTFVKPDVFQEEPKVPSFDKEAKEAVEYDGLPPIEPKSSAADEADLVLFTGIKTVFARDSSSPHGIKATFSAAGATGPGQILVRNGAVLCSAEELSCMDNLQEIGAIGLPRVVDLKGGSIAPGLTSFGSPLGLEEIQSEMTAQDGFVGDSLSGSSSPILGDALVSAVDGLQFATRDAFLAYRAGVTSAIVAPLHEKFYSGIGTYFSTGSLHKLQRGAVIRDKTGVHFSVRHFGRTPSVSTQVAALRKLILGAEKGPLKDVLKGTRPLVIEAHSADIIATLIELKHEIEESAGNSIKLTVTGGAEAHLVAEELGRAHVGVIVAPPRPFPYKWEDRRILPGPPLSEESAITKLMKANVTVGIGIEEIWSARNTRFDLAWASIESGGWMSQSQALAIASTNLETLLGADEVSGGGDFVATEGGNLLEMGSKVVGVFSSRAGVTHLF
jgi:imidazolonepropionase-like amidohydrolase